MTGNTFKRAAVRVATGAVVGATAFGFILTGSVAANAANEPSGGNTVGNHVAVGSDTLQDIYGAWANTSSYGLDSFKAFTSPASATITLNASGGNSVTSPAGNTVARPAGSGDGVKLLSATYGTSNLYTSSTNNTSTTYQINQANPVVDIARSSSRPSSSLATTWANAKLVYVPLARDAVSVAVKNQSTVTNLTTAELTALYGTETYQQTSGTWTVGDIAPRSAKGTSNPVLVTGVSGGAITTYIELDPKLPQAGSGTRSFFLGAIGVTTPGSWVEDTKTVGGVTTPIAENDASQLTAAGQIVPFSSAQWIAQFNGVVTSTLQSDVALVNINGQTPFTVSGGTASAGTLYGDVTVVPATGSGVFARDVYSVVKKSNFGSGSAPVIPSSGLGKLVATTLPGDGTTIGTYGFKQLNYTGTGTGWQYSLWAN